MLFRAIFILTERMGREGKGDLFPTDTELCFKGCKFHRIIKGKGEISVQTWEGKGKENVYGPFHRIIKGKGRRFLLPSANILD